MVTAPSAGTAELRRLIQFAADVSQLANQRADLDLHRLIDDLHRDFTTAEED